MNKINFTQDIFEGIDKSVEDAIVVCETETQNLWRESDFEVYSKNKDQGNFDILIIDGTTPKNYGDLIENAQIVMKFDDLFGRVKNAENLIEQVLNENINYRNSINLEIESLGEEFECETSAFRNFNKITFFANDEKIIERIRANLDNGEDDSFYLSWINGLKKVISEKEGTIRMKEKDVDSLEEHIKTLKEKYCQEINNLKSKKKRMEKTLEELKKERDRIKKEKEEMMEERDKEVNSLRLENENLKREIEEIKRNRDMKIESLKKKIDDKVREIRDEKDSEINSLHIENENLRTEVEQLKKEKLEEIEELKDEKNNELKEREREFEEKIRKKEKEIKILKKELVEIKNSVSYRLGSSIGNTKIGKLIKEE